MSDNYRIDSHKLIYHPKRVAEWQDGYKNWDTAKAIYPIYVEVSPVGACNHRCSFCAVDFMGYKNVKIPYDVMVKNINDMASVGVKSIMFAGEGEPTLYKELPEIMDLCTKVGIDTSLTTNMVPFNEQNTESFVKNAKWIKTSINAGDRETYAAIHNTKASDFDKVVENFKRCVALKKEHGYTCTIGAQILLLDDNAHSVCFLAEICRDVGLDYLVVKPYSQHLSSITTKYKNIEYSKLISIEKELQHYNTANFKVVFRSNTMKKTFSQNEKYKQCYSTPFLWSYITASGDVYGCSCFLGDESFSYGNINNQVFSEAWQSEKRHQNYDLMKNFDVSNCRVNCRMDEINRYLWDLEHPSEHVNFI